MVETSIQRQRRVVVRRDDGEVKESLDNRISQALASHRLLLAAEGRADRSSNSSSAAVGGNVVMTRVPDGMAGCAIGMYHVEISLNRDNRTRSYSFGSRVRKVIQGGAAGKSINTISDYDPDDNAYRVMESITEAPIPRSVIEDLNFQGIVDAGVALLKAHMPTVDVQIWAFEFAKNLVAWSSAATRSREGGASRGLLEVDMVSARELIPGLNAWVTTKACSDFPGDRDHYDSNPINCLADLVIVQFCAEFGVS